MAQADDTQEHGEAWPQEAESAGIEASEPSDTISRDPVLVRGTMPKDDRPSRLVGYILAGLALAAGSSTVLPHRGAYPLVAVGILLLVVGVGFLRTFRPRGRHAPWVRATPEGITVSDLTGTVSSAEWSDVTEVTVRAATVGTSPMVSIEWHDRVGGQTVANLGDTLDPLEIVAAIRSRAPGSTAVTVVSKND